MKKYSYTFSRIGETHTIMTDSLEAANLNEALQKVIAILDAINKVDTNYQWQIENIICHD